MCGRNIEEYAVYMHVELEMCSFRFEFCHNTYHVSCMCAHSNMFSKKHAYILYQVYILYEFESTQIASSAFHDV